MHTQVFSVFCIILAHFLLCFKNANTNLPFRVVRYFWLELVGLLGMVMAIQFMAIND